MTKIQQQLQALFVNYIQAFRTYNIAALQSCYHLPCTLHTPDKSARIDNEQAFVNEFSDIFTLLRNADTDGIIATAASYNVSTITNDVVLIDVCIDWAFIEKTGDLFSDFSAFYQLIFTQENLKIISVVSQFIENSVKLAQPLDIVEPFQIT